MTDYTHQQIRTLFQRQQSLSFEESFDVSRYCANNLTNKETEFWGRDTVIRALDSWKKLHPATYTIWNDLIEAAGLYPYIESKDLSNSSAIRYETHLSPYLNKIYLHSEQLTLSSILNSSRSVVVSAPTSFGKSLLIEEIVASMKYSNVVIVQPTLALLDETRKKITKYKSHYNIIVSTFQRPSTNKNIFLLTAERVVEYIDLPQIDFFVIDEFYKLSLDRDDERALILNQALYNLLKFTNKFYLLGPSVKSVSSEFTDKYDALWYKTDFATVSVDVENIFAPSSRKNNFEKISRLFDLLDKLDESTLIYCSSPAKANDLMMAYADHVVQKGVQDKNSNNDIIEWLSENIHSDWHLIDALRKGIGVHQGALPRHLGSSIVDAFNNENIKYLFCTSTLIEGVNTATKNVVLFDKKKGKKPIDYFDYRNIIGRSGRMNRHYIGKVFQFDPEPTQTDLDIEVPLFSQINAPLELLVQLDHGDLQDAGKERLKKLETLDLGIMDLIKMNAGITIDGQLKLIELLEENIYEYHPILRWTSIPKYDQLSSSIELIWEYLLKPGESKGNARSPRQLALYTFRYFRQKSIKALINTTISDPYIIKEYPDTDKRVQFSINLVLQITRTWFEYKLPKLLSVLSNIQSFIFTREGLPPGDFTYFSSQIENNFLSPNLAALMEYDIPISAIRKIASLSKKDFTPEDILNQLRKVNLNKMGLIDYEIKKIRAVL